MISLFIVFNSNHPISGGFLLTCNGGFWTMAGRKYNASEFDINLGHAISVQRNMRGLSQRDLARHLGITFQQVNKYESGTNRIGARTLYEIAKFFEISVDKLVLGATSKFNEDSTIQQTMDLMYTKMDTSQRQLILRLATYIAKA